MTSSIKFFPVSLLVFVFWAQTGLYEGLYNVWLLPCSVPLSGDTDQERPQEPEREEEYEYLLEGEQDTEEAEQEERGCWNFSWRDMDSISLWMESLNWNKRIESLNG